MNIKDVVARGIIPLDDGDVSGAIALLRSASLRELRDESFLREEFLLQLGLNGELVDEFPESLYPWCGHGIRSWQYPIQFAKYLTFLAEKDIRSYVEIGCRFGGTLIIVVEYLRRFSDLYRVSALDITQTDIMTSYAAQTIGVDYLIGDSTGAGMCGYLGSASWDLAFIDGDHSYQGVSTDFESVKHRSKYIALHDIVSVECEGVVQKWQEIRQVMPGSRTFEATDQYREVNARMNAAYLGIGVVDFS